MLTNKAFINSKSAKKTSSSSNATSSGSSSSSPFKWARRKTDNDPPKKPLSSYNIYFLLERDRIVNGDDDTRIYTKEDVQNIVEQQKWNHTYRKRQHRKTHGKVTFHDLSRVVANNWRQLSDEQKSIFNHQAAIEKQIYKQALDAWVMKQMKQGQLSQSQSQETTAALGSSSSLSSLLPREPPNTKWYEHHQPLRKQIRLTQDQEQQEHNQDEIMVPIALENEEHTQIMSSEEMQLLLGCFKLLPTHQQQQSGNSSVYSPSTTNEALSPPVQQQTTTTTTERVSFPGNFDEDVEYDPNDWIRLPDGPLWYDEHQLKGCSEEFALKMIQNDDRKRDRAITL